MSEEEIAFHRECFVRKHAPLLMAGLWASSGNRAYPEDIIEALEELHKVLQERYK